jgi:hypothetical protein
MGFSPKFNEAPGVAQDRRNLCLSEGSNRYFVGSRNQIGSKWRERKLRIAEPTLT